MDNLLVFTGLIWLGAFFAGFLGALTGLGGGVVIVPMLVLLFHVDLRYAIGASLVSGALKVLALDQAMRLPFKVSTTTSNFMIGVTAAASAGVYLSRGYINPGLALPVLLGVLLGSLLGAKVLAHARVKTLRLLFA